MSGTVRPLRPLWRLIVEIGLLTVVVFTSPANHADQPWRAAWFALVVVAYVMVEVNLVGRLVLRLLGDHDP